MKLPFQKLFDKTFLRFLIVGFVNTIVGTSVMFLCYNLFHFSYWVSSGMNYISGSIVSFFLNKNYTFKVKETNWKYIVKFIVNILICYLIAYGIAKPLAALLLENSSKTIQENGAMIVGMVLFVITNYCGQRFFAFKPINSESNKE